MIDDIIIPESSEPEMKSLVLDINERLDELDRRITQGATTQRGYMSAPVTVNNSFDTSPVLGWQDTRTDVNIIQFLDPLWQELRDNSVAVRETRVGFDSVGAENLKVNSVTARSVRAQSITTDALRAGSVTADKISVSTLSAIVANLGTITAGTITLDTAGYIRGGATTYNSGVGFWMGYDSTAYKFFIGNSAGNKLLFDGTNLTITGAISATSGTIGGFNIGADYIRDVANSFGLASTVTGGDDVRFWAGDTFANRATAPIRIFESGSVTIAGGSINIASTNRILASDDASYLTWQGPSSFNAPGFYAQQSAAAGGLDLYGVGSGSPGILTARSGGSFATPSDIGSDTQLFALAISGRLSATFPQLARLKVGNVATTGSYFKWEVSDTSSNLQSLVFNEDGRLYFNPPNDGFSPNSGIYGAPYVQEPKTCLFRDFADTLRTLGNLEVDQTLTCGTFQYGTYTVSAAAPVTGYITMKDSGGTTRHLAVV